MSDLKTYGEQLEDAEVKLYTSSRELRAIETAMDDLDPHSVEFSELAEKMEFAIKEVQADEIQVNYHRERVQNSEMAAIEYRENNPINVHEKDEAYDPNKDKDLEELFDKHSTLER